MKENFVKLLREAKENKTIYSPNKNINDTLSQTPKQNETNYQYDTNNSINTNPTINKEPPGTIAPNGDFSNIPQSDNIEKPNLISPIKQAPIFENNPQISPSKNINQIIETAPSLTTNCEQILAVWRTLFPTIPGGIGVLSNYNPQTCSGKTYNFNFSNNLSEKEIAKLIREIYLRVLRALDTYSLLIRNENSDNQKQLVLLRTQMQVLSSAMLNVYQDYTATNVTPLRNTINSCLPKKLKDAYCYLHDEIFYVYYLLNMLIFNLKNDTNFYSQLVIILNNLKYQLSILNTLYLNFNS